jgi:hypothetical protein
MMSMDVVERPDWFNEESYKRLKNQFFIAVWYSLTQSSFLPLPLSKAELKKFEDNVAMHFCISGSSFTRVVERHLLEAFKIARLYVVLLDRRKLADTALDRCYLRRCKVAY